MKKRASALTAIFSLLLVTSVFPLSVEDADAVIVPHLNPDPLVLTIDTLNNSKVCFPNLEINLQFTICNDIGASVIYKLSPSNGWFVYSIDDTQNMTANPNVVSRVVSTVTSHHGGPTQYETTKYNVTIDLHSVPTGLHKMAAYVGISVLLGTNPMFGDGVDLRPFEPLYVIVDGLPNAQAISPSTSNSTDNSNFSHIEFDLPIVAVSVVAFAIIGGVGLLLYRRHRKTANLSK